MYHVDMTSKLSSAQFLKLFPNTVIRYIDDQKRGLQIKTPTTFQASEVPAGYGSFFTVNGFHGNDKHENNIKNINGVQVDIDRATTKEELLMAMSNDLLPTIINQTKNGFHCIWLFKPPILTVTPELVATVKGINRAIQKKYDGDAAATDVARLLRIPGTMHQKDKNAPYIINTVYYVAKNKYTLEELTNAYQPDLRETQPVVQGTLTIDADTALARMLQRDDIRKLYEGDVPQDSLSESDLALCNHLAFWLQKDTEAIRTAWLASPLGQREKTQSRKDYQDRTILNAIASTKDVYTQKKQPSSTDSIVERDDYLKHFAQQAWDDKEWVKKLERLRERYVQVFHTYFAIQHPHLLFEKGEDRIYWEYDEANGIYVELSVSSVKALVSHLLEKEEMVGKATEGFIKNCLLRYRGRFPERGCLYDDFDVDDNWFHAHNGWVHLETLAFEPHTPTRRSRLKSAVGYDSTAVCPRYDQFLDSDLLMKPDQTRVVDQFSGLCLTNEIKYQKMLTLIGRTGCGKSTLMDAWNYVIGDMMIEKKLTELQSDASRFAGAQFIGKRLCWFDEVDVKKAEMGNGLGTLVTGLHVSVERKGVNGIVSARNTLKCVLTANRLPLSAEIGVFRRLILIPIKVSFSEDGREDREMHTKLKREASGILNRMIRGLQDLKKMGGFTLISGHDDLIEEYKASADTVAEFLDEHFEPGAKEDVISSKVLYNTYQRYTDGNSFTRTISPQKFGQLLSSQPLVRFSHIEPVRSKTGKSWTGLRVKEGYQINRNAEILEVSVVDF